MPGEGSPFDWTVSDKQVDQFRERVPVVSPEFKVGDMLLFDNWLLHRTNRRPGMNVTRYAIESWFSPSVRIVALSPCGSSNNQRGRLRGPRWDIHWSERKQY